MATQLQIRRGTSAQVAAFTGAEGEIVVNTTNDSVHVNDGSTAGGFEMARADLNNVSDTDLNAALTGNTVSALTVTALTCSGIDVTGTVTAERGAIYSGVLSEQSQLRLGYSSDYHWSFGRENATTGDLFIESSLTGTDTTRLKVGANGDISFYEDTGTTPKLFWDASAESLGIGTSSPSSVLTAISGASADETVLTVGNDYSTADAAGDASGLMFQLYRSYAPGLNDAGFIKAEKEQAWDESGDRDSALTFGTRSGGTEPTEAMRINSSGYVNPKANVATTNAPDTQGLHFGWNYSNGAGESLIVFNRGAGTTGGLTFVDNSSSGTHDEIMRLEGGNLLVGKTSASDSTDGIWIDGGGRLFSTNTSDYTAQFRRNGTDGIVVYFLNDAALAGNISVSGSTTAYNTSSDYRLKTDVQAMTGATNRLKQLNPVNFEWIAEGTRVDGFLAHEVQDIVPEAIIGTHNEVDADGNPVYQGIDQSKLVPLLVATIKELEARITALENA